MELSSSVSGIIGTIDVDRSDSVDKDQVVAKLRPDVLRLELPNPGNYIPGGLR